MEYAYSIRSIDKLKEYNLFLETHKSKIAAYIDFIQNSYSVKDLPEYKFLQILIWQQGYTAA